MSKYVIETKKLTKQYETQSLEYYFKRVTGGEGIA